MRYTVSILDGPDMVLAAEVLADPAERGMRRVTSYRVVDARADLSLVRDLVMDQVVSGHADHMIELNGFHDVKIAGQIPFLRFRREDCQQMELFESQP